MRPLLVIIVGAAVAAVLLATDTPRAPAVGRSTLVTFHRSGGLAGVDDRVTVKSDRHFVVRSRGSSARHGRLSAAAMDKLRHALSKAQLDRPVSQGQGGCADCFIYTITYKGHRVELSEDRVPARMRPAIDRLSRLIGS